MHHFPASKGDSLCPLGFHPQVRWPTRCKRCFRDYKEHYNRKKEENSSLRKDTVTASSPSISNSFNSKSDYPRSWASSDNLYEGKLETELTEYKSTLDLVNLDDNSSAITTVNLRLPKRRSYSIDQTDKDHETSNDKNKTSSSENSSLSTDDKDFRRIEIKEVKSICNGPTNNDVQYVIQVKKKPGKATADILENNINHTKENETKDSDKPLLKLQQTLKETEKELEALKQKCDRLEKEKRDVILRRLPSMDSANKSNSEFNKLQQKCNELQKEINVHQEEKSNLQLKIRILEDEMKRYPKEKISGSVEELRSKLKAAETLCEELMDENENLKKDLRDMEEQIDEMQDNFREDQVAEYTSLKAELEQTTKNCRILSFKLRKAEKRNEQFEIEKRELEKQFQEFSEKQTSADSLERIKRLEQELAESLSLSTKLQNELGLLNKKLSELESSKGEGRGTKNTEVKKISRQSLIRSGSQEEPIILAQVPDTSEIERDLREQLKFSEEEADNLRKTISRIENDNEVLLLQLKKLTARIRNRPGLAKDVIDDEELKMQLELSEQEISPIKGRKDLEKPLSKSQVTTSKRMSEDKTNKKLVEYEQQIKELKATIEEEKLKNKQKQTELTKSMKKWENESKKLKTQIESLEETNGNLNESIKTSETTITKLEKKIASGKVLLRTAQAAEIEKLKIEVDLKNSDLASLQSQLSSAQALENEMSRKLKDLQAEKERSEQEYEKRMKQLEIDLKAEKKKFELLRKESETRNNELRTLKLRMNEKDPRVESKLQAKIDELSDLNRKISTELKEANVKLNDLTAKHEDLEEEFSLTKAKMDVEKESLNSELQTIKQRLNNLLSEKRELEEEFEKQRHNWLMEKSKIQEKFNKTNSNGGDNNDLDKMRFNSLIGEKQSELDKYRKENESLSYQIDYMKRESDEIKRKLDDYEKVNKIQRNMSADSSAMEKEVRDLKKKIEMVEKSRKADILKCKMSYEEQLATVNNELKLLQTQIIRFKKEKDTYKNMLQSAQKSMGDMKFRRDVTNKFDKGTVKTETLEVQLSSLEDELSEIKLEYSKLKTQHVSDKSSYEVKILEMQTRINELEEEKILNSGRTKIAGLRTCMELSWQKEREEQQRLLQETATLARDLRQTLFEVEKERDKERLEAKRKYEQFRRSVEEEQLEARKKIKDLQCDLLELRDAHAKLRTTNERLKREKDRLRKDEDTRAKSLSRTNLDGSTSGSADVSVILQHIDTLKCLANEVEHLDEKQKGNAVTPEDKKDKLDNVVSSLLNISQDLFAQMREVEKEKLLVPRRMGQNNSTKLNRQGSLKRRSLSLEQTSTIQREQNIWQADQGSMSSLRSANSDLDMYGNMSDTSIQSDLVDKKKKKKGIIGKIKKMTKSRSVDEADSGILSSLLGKKPSSLENLNNTITGMFRRGGSSSRSNSMERTKLPESRHDTSSRQRPLMKMKSESPAR